ncbi:gustatory receptor-like 36a [Drosophila suzukii]|uniref:Gustatory receptor-like 36a n=1 Tax=Drosophila suzukii TaxID=28584 RepID=A0AB39ZEM6_DROSZ
MWQSRLLRWSVLGICWTSYIFYRGCVIGQIKFDTEKKKLIIQPRNIWTKRIALCLKIIAFSLNYFGIPYFSIAFVLFLPKELSKTMFSAPKFFEILLSSVIMQLSIINTIRLCYWMSSPPWNRSFVGLVNDVIDITKLMEDTVGPLYLEGISLLILHTFQIGLTILQIVGYTRMQFHIFSLYNLLLELFFNLFVVYQLLLLSWIAAFNRFLKIYLQERKLTERHGLKILQLFRLYSRISNVHRNIQLIWLPVIGMLFSDILLLVSSWAFIIKSIIFNRWITNESLDRKYWIAALGAQASFLRILIIGLGNDQLALLQCFLRLQLLVIDLSYLTHDQQDQNFDWDVKTLQCCFDLQLRVQPIRNRIISVYQECGCPFVLDLFFCTLINALCCAQYGMSFDIHSLIFSDVIK